MKALEKPHIQLICNPYECDLESSINKRITMDVMQKDLTRDEMLEVFESFMKSIGYDLDEMEYLSIEKYTEVGLV